MIEIPKWLYDYLMDKNPRKEIHKYYEEAKKLGERNIMVKW